MERMFVGIDVAKDRLDVHVRPSGEAFAVARDGKGLDELVARLRGRDVALIVLEATGGFETTVTAALCAVGLPLVVANPRQVRDFARATGRLAKTDAIDAAVIAHFADAVRPEPRPVPDAEARALGELLTRRRQIVEMMTAERNRRKRLADRRMIKSIDRLLKALQRELSDLEEALDDTIRGTPAWRETEDLLKSVPGIGDVTARRPPAHPRPQEDRGPGRWGPLQSRAPCGASAPSGAAVPTSAPRSTWPLSSQAATTQR